MSRRPIAAWSPYKSDDGPHEGIEAANFPTEAVPIMIATDGSPRPGALEWLATRASMDDVADLLEALAVHRSWEAARLRNRDAGVNR